MNKFFISLLFYSFSSISSAEWVLVETIADIKTTDKSKIARSFIWVPDARHFLTEINLTEEEKLTVTKAEVFVGYYKWKNDDECILVDPNQSQRERMYTFIFEFYHGKDKANNGAVGGTVLPALDCVGRTVPAKVERKRIS